MPIMSPSVVTVVLPFEINKFPDGFPPELVWDILTKFIQNIKKGTGCYEYFLREPQNSSRYIRKMLPHQEHRQLSNDEAIAKYAKKALKFHRSLGAFGIHFGSLRLLELVMPSESTLSAKFCKAFAVSGIIQLNLDCDSDREDFLEDVVTWVEGLSHLEVLRIKYRPRMTQEGPDHLYPWYKPQWLGMLSLCTNLKVLALSTYLPLYEDPMDPKWEALVHPEIAIIEDWSQGRLPSLERVYLRHGRDEFSPISSAFTFGEDVLLELKKPGDERNKYTPSRWNFFDITPPGTHRYENLLHPHGQEHSIRKEDIDIYATDSNASDDEDNS